jgi:hypothetical protein
VQQCTEDRFMQVETPKIRGVSYNNDASFLYAKLPLS